MTTMTGKWGIEYSIGDIITVAPFGGDVFTGMIIGFVADQILVRDDDGNEIEVDQDAVL